MAGEPKPGGWKLYPEIFEAFFPDMETGKYAKKNDASAYTNTRIVPVYDPDGDWYHAGNRQDSGFTDYRYLGAASNGWHGYLVRNNQGGTLTRAYVFFVTVNGTTITRMAAYEAQNIRDNPVTLRGDTLYYGSTAIDVASLGEHY